jgi:type I restriction enzyme, S subunit
MTNQALKPGWSYRSLNELGSVGRGRSRHRPRNAPELYGGSHPFIQTAEVTASEFCITEYSKTYSDLGLAQSKMWNKGTLCIVNAGENTAETAILDFKACFPDSIIGFVSDSAISDVRFVKYYLSTIKPQLRSVTKGATQDNLSVDKLLSFQLLIPPLSKQNRIADIISTYDDLIENNTRRIKILEEMAQLLYREWFVNFRFPGYEDVELVESAIGLIPEGWEIHKLGDVVELAYGKALKANDRTGGEFAVYGSSGIVGYHDKYLVQSPGIVVGRKGNVGSIFWSDIPFYPIDTVYYVQTEICLHYIYYNLQTQNFINNDAAVPGLNRNQAYSLPFLLPEQKILQKFQDFVAPLLQQCRRLKVKNENLRQTRDLLLPKLISGEIDVEALNLSNLDQQEAIAA